MAGSFTLYYSNAGVYTHDSIGTPAILAENDSIGDLVQEDYLCSDDDVTTSEVLTDAQIIDAIMLPVNSLGSPSSIT